MTVTNRSVFSIIITAVMMIAVAPAGSRTYARLHAVSGNSMSLV